MTINSDVYVRWDSTDQSWPAKPCSAGNLEIPVPPGCAGANFWESVPAGSAGLAAQGNHLEAELITKAGFCCTICAWPGQLPDTAIDNFLYFGSIKRPLAGYRSGWVKVKYRTQRAEPALIMKIRMYFHSEFCAWVLGPVLLFLGFFFSVRLSNLQVEFWRTEFSSQSFAQKEKLFPHSFREPTKVGKTKSDLKNWNNTTVKTQKPTVIHLGSRQRPHQCSTERPLKYRWDNFKQPNDGKASASCLM